MSAGTCWDRICSTPHSVWIFACWRTRTAISVLARQRSGPNFASSSRFAKRVRKLRLLRVTISRYISLGQTLRRAFIQPTQSPRRKAGHVTFVTDAGMEYQFRAGVAAYFPPNTKGVWTIHEKLRKTYVVWR